MKELSNKPSTNPSEETINKKTLQFSNSAIDKYLPTFGNLRYKSIPFKVPLRSHLKGIRLNVSRASKKKCFVLRYWFQGKYLPYTLGTYGPRFGVKEVSKKLFKIVEEHTNDKGLWIKDPKITKKDDETKITKSQFKNSQRKTVRETIELLCKAGFPRMERGGNLSSRVIASVVRVLIGYNWRTAHLRYRDRNDGTGYVVFRINKVYSKKNKLTQIVKDWDGLFNKFPPGDPKYFIKNKAKTRNPLGMISLYDDDQFGKLLMEDFTSGAIKRFLNNFKGYGSKINVIYSLKVLWTFAKDTGLLGDKPGDCPLKEVPNKRPPITQKTPGMDKAFTIPELEKIYKTSFLLSDLYPFGVEEILLQMFSGRHVPELLKIREEQIDYVNRQIHLPAHTHKVRKVDQFITITTPIAEILERLRRKKQDPRYQKVKDVPWIFPGFRWEESKRHDYNYINSDITRMKTTHHCWEEMRRVGNFEGTRNMFRKTYSTLAKDELKSTTSAIRLTGHLNENTLDRYYYKSHKDVIQKDADQVALLFDFAKYKKTG
jgi:integrase